MKNEKEFMVQKIRTQYMESKYTELDALKALDKKVKLPANVFAYVFGSVGALVAGTGMSLTMTDIGAALGIEGSMIFGIIIGIVGFALCAVNYPIYKVILAKRKEQYKDEIFALADKASM